MAKQPRFTVRGEPAGGGPLVVVQSNAGQADLAVAGFGRTLAQMGAYLTAQGKEAEDKTKRLQQATDTSRYSLHATQRYQELRDDLAKEPDPDARLPRYQALQAELRQELAAIGDEEVRARSEIWLNDESAVWEADIRTGTQQLRVKQEQEHFAVLYADGMQRRDTSQIEEHLRGLQEQGFLSEQQVNDTLGQFRTLVATELDKDRIAATVNRMQYSDAVAYLKDQRTWSGLNLSEQEITDYKNLLHSRLDTQRAAEALAARRHEQQVDANDRQALAAAWTGQIDVTTVPAAVTKGELSAAVGREIMAIAKEGPRRENDPEIFMEAERWLREVREQRQSKEEALTWLKEHASRLTPTTWEGYVRDVERTGAPDDPLATPHVKLLDRLLDEHYETLQTFGDWGTPAAEAAYLEVKQRFRDWLRRRPEASEAEITEAWQALVRPVAEPALWKQILGRLGPVNMRGRTWTRGGEIESFALTDGQREPLTRQEFEDTVKSLPPGSEEQRAYYEKWVKKWR